MPATCSTSVTCWAVSVRRQPPGWTAAGPRPRPRDPIGPTSASTNPEMVLAAAAGCRITCSYRSVVSRSAGMLLRSLAIVRTEPRQRIAHFPASDRPGHAARSASVSMPKNGLGNSLSTLATPGLNQASALASASIAATTSRPSRMICTIRASGNASTSPSAQYIRSGVASPYLRMSRSATQGPTPFTPPASRQDGEQARQACAVTYQACANASRSTVAAASNGRAARERVHHARHAALADGEVEAVRALQGAREQVRSRVGGADDEHRLADLAAVDDQDVRTRCHDWLQVWHQGAAEVFLARRRQWWPACSSRLSADWISGM